jgi:rhodanese-related sulfurtransferase
MPQEMEVEELARRRAGGELLTLIDIREPWEREIASIGGDRHIPMEEIPSRLGEIPRDRPVVVYCHAGIRSYAVAGFLEQSGWENVVSLSGGIDAWSSHVDPGVARY